MRRTGWLRVALAAVIACLLATVAVQAAGTATVTTRNSNGVTTYIVAWTSDASGNVTGNKFSIKASRLLGVKFVPNTGGTQPTNNYTAALVDDDGVDVLNSQFSGNLSNTTAKDSLFDPPMPYDSTVKLDLQISGAGASKTGTFYLWVQ